MTRTRNRYRMALPLALEQRYERELEQVGIWAANKCAEIIIPSLSSYGAHSPVNDAIKAMIRSPFAGRLDKAVFEAFSPALLKKVANGHAERVSMFQRQQLTQALTQEASTGPWVGRLASSQVSGLMDTWVGQNVELIKSVPGQYLESVENLIEKGVPQGMTVRELAKQIEDHGHVAVNKAKLIARDQTTKLYGRLNKARQQSVGLNRYIWDGVGDERERETHRILNGKVFSWDNPPITNEDGETNDPGEDIQCRCTGSPYLEDLGI